MSAVAIDKHIPLPKREPKYPVWRLEVGDSFKVPCDRSRINWTQECIWGAIGTAKKHHPETKNWKFETHRVEGGVRVWRIK